jgi:hypothetical protein
MTKRRRFMTLGRSPAGWGCVEAMTLRRGAGSAAG